MFDMKLTSKDLPVLDGNKASKVIEKEGGIRLNNVLLTIQNSIATVTPVGATGDLRSSLRTDIKRKGGNLIGSVFFGKKYALPVNDGRKASPVSRLGQQGLARWIEKSRKGRSYFSGLKSTYPKVNLRQATFLLARSLKLRERVGQKFFEKGIENAKADINRFISRLGDSLVKGLVK
jgi:hypothetical protein